jgi:hypothetical protein
LPPAAIALQTSNRPHPFTAHEYTKNISQFTFMCVQVIRLCEGCGLYSALAYIHNNALADFRKPLTDLLAAVAGAAAPADAARYCYKLLVYLRCCFRGLAFPPGTGSLPR